MGNQGRIIIEQIERFFPHERNIAKNYELVNPHPRLQLWFLIIMLSIIPTRIRLVNKKLPP